MDAADAADAAGAAGATGTGAWHARAALGAGFFFFFWRERFRRATPPRDEPPPAPRPDFHSMGAGESSDSVPPWLRDDGSYRPATLQAIKDLLKVRNARFWDLFAGLISR